MKHTGMERPVFVQCKFTLEWRGVRLQVLGIERYTPRLQPSGASADEVNVEHLSFLNCESDHLKHHMHGWLES